MTAEIIQVLAAVVVLFVGMMCDNENRKQDAREDESE